MSYKTILVRSEADWGSDRAIEVAVQVAELFDAVVFGVGAEVFNQADYGFADGELIAAALEQIDIDLTASKARFDTLTKDRQPSSNWVSGKDTPLDMMVRHARSADLLAVRRPDKHAEYVSSCKVADLVMDAGLPVLIAAHGPSSLQAKQVVVAWHDRREATRAVSDAMPFLLRADGVHLVSVRPAVEREDAEVSLRAVQRRLARHGVHAEIERVEPTRDGLAFDLETVASRVGADLIVAGAYSHSRLREWALGGLTEALIAQSSKFVLLSR